MKWLGVLVVIFLACLAPRAGHAQGTPTCGAPRPYGTVACFVDQRIDLAALCADGTQPTYWYRPGFSTGANVWVIWLEGGGACDSQAECAYRLTKPQYASQLTSNGWVATPGQGLISWLMSENPALFDANTILLHYCSSDAWTGTKLSGVPFNINDSSTWNFAGKRIVVAQIKSLLEYYPALQNATEIVLGGDSSGGVGITEDYNNIAPLLPAGAVKLFVNDAGFTQDIGQYEAALPPPYVYQGHPNSFEQDIQTRFAYWNAQGDVKCDLRATTAQQQQNCYDTDYILQNGFIQAPQFVATSQLDTSQVTEGICPDQWGYCPVPRNPEKKQGVYATAFGEAMATDMVGTGGQAGYTVFAPDQYEHVLLENDAMFETPFEFAGGEMAPRDAFDAWLANPFGPRVVNLGTGPGVAPANAQ